MPELVKRMGHLPVVEPAEEIRLGLAQLVAAVVERSPPQLLTAFAGDLCMFLCRWAACGVLAAERAVGCMCCVCCVCCALLGPMRMPMPLAHTGHVHPMGNTHSSLATPAHTSSHVLTQDSGGRVS